MKALCKIIIRICYIGYVTMICIDKFHWVYVIYIKVWHDNKISTKDLGIQTQQDQSCFLSVNQNLFNKYLFLK